METTLQKIIRKTGKKITQCKCHQCRKQCAHPCIGTPDDMVRIAAAGYKDRLNEISWETGITFGLCNQPIIMVAPVYDQAKKSCTFFTNGLCELHHLGLKPTEGKLSHHSTTAETFNPRKSIAWACAKEWIKLK